MDVPNLQFVVKDAIAFLHEKAIRELDDQCGRPRHGSVRHVIASFPLVVESNLIGVVRPLSFPMSHPLDGCRAKVERAKELVLSLGGEVTGFLAEGRHVVQHQNQFERRRYVFRLVGPPVPLRFAVLAGEIVHHLRSCLDHIVWALATKEGQLTSERIAFPVCSTPQKFRTSVKKGIISGVPNAAVPLIDALQPYRSSDPANSIVQVVHDLDIADKHKLLVVVTHMMVLGNTIVVTRNECADPTFGIELPPISVGPQGQATTQYPWTIEDGVEVHSVPYRSKAKPELELEMQSTIHVAFERIGTLTRQPIIPTLTTLLEKIEAAINPFDALFR